jgi:hypothetical protein
MSQFKTVSLLAALSLCLGLSACHSPYVETSIINHTGGTARLIEVDYPGGSFGTQQIAEGATYRYHFKILDSAGPVKITYTGKDGKTHTATGPVLDEGQQGDLSITIDADGKVAWLPQLNPSK